MENRGHRTKIVGSITLKGPLTLPARENSKVTSTGGSAGWMHTGMSYPTPSPTAASAATLSTEFALGEPADKRGRERMGYRLSPQPGTLTCSGG